MTKKPFPTDAITNELAGASLFFQSQTTPVPEQAPEKAAAAIPPMQPVVKLTPPIAKPTASQPVNKVASPKASTLASYQRELIETIRRTVKKSGKEVSFVRLSQTEKDLLADIVYTYKRQGMKTTENEINRIAINFLLEDYKRNGEESMLAKVIEALLA
jgi:hypothetical protein